MEPPGAELGLSTGLPAAPAEQTDVCGALGREERTAFSFTAGSSLGLCCSFGKLVLFARQPLVSSSVVPQIGICGHLR